MANLTPKDFLKSKGIKLKTTTLLSVVDGYMRQPDLCLLFEEYATLKTQEFFEKEFLKFMERKMNEKKDSDNPLPPPFPESFPN